MGAAAEARAGDPWNGWLMEAQTKKRVRVELLVADDSVHAWRSEQLQRLGVPRLLAEAWADLVDWHAIAELVGRGCTPELALRIVR